MKKTIIIMIMIAIITIMTVNAIKEIDYQKKCDIIRPATDYRPAKIWYNAGILGRLSNGQITCFIPTKHTNKQKITQNNNKEQITCTNKETTIEECTTNTQCTRPKCHKEKTTCKHYKTETIWVKNHCNNEHENCECQSKKHQNCHQETKNTCTCWNYEQICTEPICTTTTTCENKTIITKICT